MEDFISQVDDAGDVLRNEGHLAPSHPPGYFNNTAAILFGAKTYGNEYHYSQDSLPFHLFPLVEMLLTYFKVKFNQWGSKKRNPDTTELM